MHLVLLHTYAYLRWCIWEQVRISYCTYTTLLNLQKSLFLLKVKRRIYVEINNRKFSENQAFYGDTIGVKECFHKDVCMIEGTLDKQLVKKEVEEGGIILHNVICGKKRKKKSRTYK